MMHTTHTTRLKSLQARGLDGAGDPIRMAVTFSHFALGPSPLPPRARVTATARIFQRKILAFAVRFAGVSHFAKTETFIEIWMRRVDQLFRRYEMTDELALETWEDEGGSARDTKRE
jgi:hypothetical protein